MVKGLLIASSPSPELDQLVAGLDGLPGLEVTLAAPGGDYEQSRPEVIHYFSPADFTPAEMGGARSVSAVVMVDVRGADLFSLPKDRGSRRQCAELWSGIDIFFCADEAIKQGLFALGIASDRLCLDPSLSIFPGGEAEQRGRMILKGGGAAMGLAKNPKWHADRVNSLLRMHDLAGSSAEWESRPSHIEFSTNNCCNLTCITCCPDGRPPVMRMTRAEGEKICNQILPGAVVLTPFGRSDPLLGDLELICDQAATHDVRLNVITNGMLLTPEKYTLMRPVLGRLQVSLDSCAADTYEQIRQGGNFARVVENIGNVAPLAAADGVEFLTSLVVMTQNYEHLPEYVDFVGDLGVRSVLFQKLVHAYPGLGEFDVELAGKGVVLQEKVVQARERAERRQMNFYSEVEPVGTDCFAPQQFHSQKWGSMQHEMQLRYPEFCYMAATYLAVHPDGKVYPCCVATPELCLGNLREQSFGEIWNGEAYGRLRSEFYAGKLRPVCRNCHIRG